MANTLDSGSSARKGLEVQLLSWALKAPPRNHVRRFFLRYINWLEDCCFRIQDVQLDDQR